MSGRAAISWAISRRAGANGTTAIRDDVRRFWRGDRGTLGTLATRLAGSSDIFGKKARPSASVNFLAAHDGFTLHDLVTYRGEAQ